ncbi:MAG: hypothetical protein JWN93_376 [Hyphomicrobiales bacterium]|nr:hypothetical protein [Hyphomicrobiales bacterium]
MGRPLPPELLLAAARTGAELGVSPERPLLQGGWIREEDYYRALAGWLGLAYLEAFEPGARARYPASILAGLAPASGDDAPTRWIIAPSGARIADLARLRALDRLPKDRFAIVTPSTMRDTMIDARAQDVTHGASGALGQADRDLSAGSPASRAQIGAGALMALAGLLGLAFGGVLWLATSLVGGALLSGYIGLRLFATVASFARPRAFPPAPDADLPAYTIVVAMYREEAVAAKLVRALDALDYPPARLDIKLVVEEDDSGTRAALAALDLPARYEVIVAPPGQPRTKPRALNIALALARGDLLVVYDAEDEPEPDQLRKAAAAFAALPGSAACLQARLAIDNVDDGWLARLFAVEYAALFDVSNPGLCALGAPAPLGGTSNHFRITALRAAGGWDAWNVTEDIDLGLRLARFGYTVEALDSTTHEEAPWRLRAWMGQRRRWFKGWMQTLIVHGRDPVRVVNEMGALRAACALLTVCGALLAPMMAPGFAWAALKAVLDPDLLAPSTAPQLATSTLWCSIWIAGLVSALWPALLGLKRQRLLGLALWLPLLPFYWLLLSAAAWWALLDLFRNPYHWAKTRHGLAKSSRRVG